MSYCQFTKCTREECVSESHSVSGERNWVAFVPIDCLSPVLCNIKTMEYARPALYLQAIRDEPCMHTPEGIPAHRTGFTKAQLGAFVSSFYVQRLVITKHVTLDEMMAIFSQQGVSLSCSRQPAYDPRVIPSGVAVARLTNNAVASVRQACDVLARGIAYWGRLEVCMDASLGSHLRPLPDCFNLSDFSGMDCTATRAWIRFDRGHTKPGFYEDILNSCNLAVVEWPEWLECMIKYLASIYVEKNLSGYTETSFLQMTEAAHISNLQELWWLERDGPRLLGTNSSRSGIRDFFSFVKRTLKENNFTVTNSQSATLPGFQQRFKEDKRSKERHFARACVAFSFKAANEIADYGTMFSGSCACDSGLSIERVEFEKALEPLDIKVVRWSDDPDKPRDAVVFPPYVAKKMVAKSSPAVLLEFPNR